MTVSIPKYTIERMNSILTTEVFDTWFADLKDKQAARRVQARIDRAEDGNLGDCKAVGEGVSEYEFITARATGIFCATRH